MYLEEKLKAEIVAEALEKSGEAISQAVDGPKSSDRTWCLYSGGVPGVWHQQVVLPLRAQARCRESRGGQLADEAYRQPPQLGLWPVFPVSAQRQGLKMESQTRVPHL